MSASDFAHLSNDIIVDVLEIGCPKFEDLGQLEVTDGRWAEVIRCGKKFAKGTVDFPHKMGLTRYTRYIKERHLYGLETTTKKMDYLHLMKSWDDLLLTDVTLRIGEMPLEFEKRILSHVTRRLDIVFQDETLDRAAGYFEILANRPIADLRIYYEYSGPPPTYCWEKPFRRLLTNNPFLQSLSTENLMFGNLDLVEAFTAFVKRPNFVRLRTNSVDKRTEKLIAAVLEHWLQMTVFPSQMQGIQFSCRNLSEFYFGSNKFSRVGDQVFYRDHPTNSSKRIEAFCRCREAEFCLTSKEETVYSEFGEYQTFELRKAMLKNGPFEKWRYQY